MLLLSCSILDHVPLEATAVASRESSIPTGSCYRVWSSVDMVIESMQKQNYLSLCQECLNIFQEVNAGRKKVFASFESHKTTKIANLTPHAWITP
jgi:hypothetical protein